MFLVTVRGSAERTLLLTMQELSSGWTPDAPRKVLTTTVVDQSALIALLCGLHELGVTIESVEPVRPVGSHNSRH